MEWLLALSVAVAWLAVTLDAGELVKIWVRRWTEPTDEWLISLDGEDLGLLTDGRFEDMFWSWYRLTPLHPAHLPKLLDADAWRRCRFSFRHRVSRRGVSSFLAGALERPAETSDGLRVLLRWFS